MFYILLPTPRWRIAYSRGFEARHPGHVPLFPLHLSAMVGALATARIYAFVSVIERSLPFGGSL